MNREIRRRLERAKKQEEKTKLELIRQETVRISEDVANEAAIFEHHRTTGRIMTIIALILRKPPYRWPAEKVERLLDRIGGTVNAINVGEISDADLVAECERRGIKVVWSAKHEYIAECNVYEEEIN